jgi:hypothetical protein
MRAAAIGVAVLVIGLGASGCGGASGSEATSTAARDRAIASYRAGLRTWGQQMITALNDMSVLFSTQASVARIETADTAVDAKLDRLERTLTGCTAAIERLGRPPVVFVPARLHALRACVSLEKGAKLVELGVKEFRGGLGVQRFTDAAGPLGDGQDDIGVVRSELSADHLG